MMRHSPFSDSDGDVGESSEHAGKASTAIKRALRNIFPVYDGRNFCDTNRASSTQKLRRWIWSCRFKSASERGNGRCSSAGRRSAWTFRTASSLESTTTAIDGVKDAASRHVVECLPMVRSMKRYRI